VELSHISPLLFLLTLILLVSWVIQLLENQLFIAIFSNGIGNAKGKCFLEVRLGIMALKHEVLSRL